MKTKINKLDLSKGLNGIEFLRNCVEALNCRPEFLNADKTPTQLINDYKKILKQQ